MHLAAKFHHPMFNHLEVTVLTNKQTDTTENILSLHYAMPVGNKKTMYAVYSDSDTLFNSLRCNHTLVSFT